MNLLILDTALFPDRETVAAAIDRMDDAETAMRIDISSLAHDAPEWDDVVRTVLKADQVMSF